jgi:hypothetical protein
VFSIELLGILKTPNTNNFKLILITKMRMKNVNPFAIFERSLFLIRFIKYDDNKYNKRILPIPIKNQNN